MRETLKGIGERHMPRAFALASVVVDWRIARDPLSEVNLLPLLAAKDELACDIGANRGLFSFWMLHLGLRVAAFEPNPHIMRVLRYRFPRALRTGRLQLFEVALSDGDGPAVLHVPRRFSPLATLEPSRTGLLEAVDDITVQRRRLDDLLSEPVGFLKIDVEGHEQRVLEGAHRLLGEYRPSILVEAEERHRPGAVASMRQMLDPLGYEGFFVHDEAMHSIDDFDVDRHQRRDALNAEGTAVRSGRSYVNNFIFIARPHMKARLQGWRPHRALTGI